MSNKTALYGMMFYWSEPNPQFFTITWKIVDPYIIRMLFDSNNTLTNKCISNLCVLLPSWY